MSAIQSSSGYSSLPRELRLMIAKKARGVDALNLAIAGDKDLYVRMHKDFFTHGINDGEYQIIDNVEFWKTKCLEEFPNINNPGIRWKDHYINCYDKRTFTYQVREAFKDGKIKGHDISDYLLGDISAYSTLFIETIFLLGSIVDSKTVGATVFISPFISSFLISKFHLDRLDNIIHIASAAILSSLVAYMSWSRFNFCITGGIAGLSMYPMFLMTGFMGEIGRRIGDKGYVRRLIGKISGCKEAIFATGKYLKDNGISNSANRFYKYCKRKVIG